MFPWRTPLCASLALSVSAHAQGVRLNGPILPTLPPGEGGDVAEPLLTPDGARVVYEADQVTNDRFGLYSVPVDGSGPVVELTEPAALGAYIARSARMDPLGTRVAFARRLTGGFEVYSAPVDGSASEVRLSAPLTPGGSVELEVSANGARALYRASELAFATQLFSAPMDGSAPALALNAALQPGTIKAFRGSPDGSLVAFAFAPSGAGYGLYVAPADGSALAVRVSGNMVAGGNVFATAQGFQFSPDGTRVVYVADQDVDGRNELYCAPADGSAAALKLSGSMVAGGNVHTFGLRVTDAFALFRADRLADERAELFRAPLDASTAPLTLNAVLPTNGDVGQFLPNADATRVVYEAEKANTFELLSVPSDGSTAATSLSGGTSAGHLTALQLAASRAFYLADSVTSGVFELFAVPVLGGAAPVRLSGVPVAGGGVTAFVVSADGTRVAYVADETSDEHFELFGAPADGSASAVRVSGAALADGDVREAAFAGAARLVYLADQESDEMVELYGAPSDGSATAKRLNDPLPGGPVAGDVFSFVATRDGRRVVYAAREESLQVELYTVALAEGLVRAKLVASLPPAGNVLSDYLLSTDDAFVLYRADPDGSGETELFGVRADGSGAPFPISGPMVAGGDVEEFRLRPAAPGVVYRADQLVDGRAELFRWNATGAPVRLFALAPFAAIRAWTFSPDGAWILLSADQEVDERYEVYTVRVGGGVLHKLSGALPNGADAGLFGELGVSPDSKRALFLADQELAGRWELYSAPLDGSAPAAKLNGALAPGGQVGMEYVCGGRECDWQSRAAPNFLVLPDSSRVLYLADQETVETLELYSAPLDGSAAPVRLSTSGTGSLVPGSLALDGVRGRALYARARPSALSGDEGAVAELFGVRTDGSAAPQLLTPALVGGGDVIDAVLEPLTGAVLYVADQDADEVRELYVVPLDASAPPQKLSAPMPAGGDVQALAFPYALSLFCDGRAVVYHADQEQDETLGYYQVPLDGSAPPQRTSAPPVPGGDASSGQLVRGRFFYLADQELDGVQELFLSFLGKPVTDASRPTRFR